MDAASAKKQIDQMVAFISNEAKDKVAEIRAKTEQDYNIEKIKLVESHKKAVREEVEKKKKNAETSYKVEISAKKNAALMKEVSTRDEQFQGLREEVKKSIVAMARDGNKMKDIYSKLMCQGALALHEGEVTVICKKSDASAVKAAVGQAQNLYSNEVKKAIGKDLQCKLVVSDSEFLPADCLGGVKVTCHNGLIVSDNTFESRLDLLMNNAKPYIKKMIYE